MRPLGEREKISLDKRVFELELWADEIGEDVPLAHVALRQRVERLEAEARRDGIWTLFLLIVAIGLAAYAVYKLP